VAVTSTGLDRISNGRVTTFDRTHGLPDAGMSQIIEDNFHTFWITTRKGYGACPNRIARRSPRAARGLSR